MDLKEKENITTGFVVYTCNFSTQEAEDYKAWASLGYRLYIVRLYFRPEGGKGGKSEEGPVAFPALLASLSTA